MSILVGWRELGRGRGKVRDRRENDWWCMILEGDRRRLRLKVGEGSFK